jgi:hypothetical protein
MCKERQGRTDSGTINCNPRSSIVQNKLTAGDRSTTSGYKHRYWVHRITLWEGRDPHTYTTQKTISSAFRQTFLPNPSIFCLFVCMFPVTCYWLTSQFHSTRDYKYNIDGRTVATDKLEMCLEEMTFVHARYCPEIIWRD